MQHPLLNNPVRFELVLRLADVATLAAAGVLASVLHFHSLPGATAPVHLVLLYLCSFAVFFLFGKARLYPPQCGRPSLRLAVTLAACWGFVLLLGLLFAFMIHQVAFLSRGWLGAWFALGAAGLFGNRAITWFALERTWGMPARRASVLVIGDAGMAHTLQERVDATPLAGYAVSAFCPATAGADTPPPEVALVADAGELPAWLDANPVDEIWIALPMRAVEQVQELQHRLREVLVEIRWIFDVGPLQLLNTSQEHFLGYPALTLNCPAPSDWHVIAKYVFDKVFAAAALVGLAPLMLLLALAIRLDSPGPALFKQPRMGLNGKRFDVYKFRTMRVHQDTAVRQATRGDARITRVGAFLRRTSLDELPQFLNVLLGDMSVVGPRPHAVQHSDQYRSLIDAYMTRHRAKPGITGWAQINGSRGETDTLDKMVRRVQLDMYYIRHWSIWMDLRIVLWTALRGWTGANVY